MGDTALARAQDTMWNNRIWVQLLYVSPPLSMC